MKNLSKACRICRENFIIDKSDMININNNYNNSYINCFDEELPNESCYYTCKSCDIKGTKRD